MKPSPLSNRTACLNVHSHISSFEGRFSLKMEDHRFWVQNAMQIQLVLFCTISGFIYFVLKRFGIPRFPCQLITGIIFGCSWKQWDAWKFDLFSVNSEDALGVYSTFGFILYVFLSSAKVNPKMIAETENIALIIGISMLLGPVISGLFIQSIFRDGLSQTQLKLMTVMLSFHSMTSFPAIYTLLDDLKMVNSKLGRLGLSSAFVTDVFSIILLTIIGIVIRFRDTPSQASMELAVILLLFALIFLVFKPAFLWIVKKTPKGKPVQRSHIQTVLFIVLICMVLSSLTDRTAIMGPYFLGLVCPDGDPLVSTLVQRIEWFVLDVFLPIEVTASALRVDVSKLTPGFDSKYSRLNIIVIFGVAFIKMISCLLSSLYCKLSFKEALTLSIMLSCKGVVELVMYTICFDKQLISEKLFGHLMFVILLFATVVPITLRFLYDPSRKYDKLHNGNNIMDLTHNSELRVFACVYKDADINNSMHLLNISCPRVDNPVSALVFHLIELIGCTTPVLISHGLPDKAGQGQLKDHSYSTKMLSSFKMFKKENSDTISVECFTAISPNMLMHDDICSLALDKTTSLIILPFHRTWTAENHVDQDDSGIRSLNHSVLDRAPCSVGIFVDRGNLGCVVPLDLGNRFTYCVCVIFIGGKDDREAISYAKRLTNDLRVQLTILRIKAPEEEKSSDDWENILDSESVRHFKGSCVGDGRTTYTEEVCMDGAQTTWRIKALVNNYNLIIVGRRHGLESPQTSGLSEWSEFPELGIVGDLIASTDANIRTSVLVLQQQK